MKIHPTAVVDPDARLDSSVRVGPYTVIEKDVQIGPDTEIEPHSIISGPTTIGARNKIGSFASIGAPPQDMHYQGEPTRLVIGDDNWIREYTSLHRGSPGGRGVTRIGNHNLLMAYTHVAHDCRLGNHVIMVNNVALAGHVEVGDRVTLGGLVAVQQFSRIGEFSFVGAMSGINLDVPPYIIVAGIRNDLQIRGINRIGLKRAGFDSQTIKNLSKAFVIIFKTPDLLLQEALEKAMIEFPDCKAVARLVQFFKDSDSNRKVMRLSSDGV
ncbi:MAG: acyl-ACP--UDP-N-acetylglucosamine O-acyltransferase [Desulfobulbaceae bacterium]|nr:acyl-ACP--UDP-N-acetylglucosamine O-acyltransferase [Desulfobulbaceae bacterium]